MGHKKPAEIINIKVFEDIAENLLGCMREKDKFECQGCEHFNTCFKVLNESVSAIATWIADQIEATAKLKDRLNLDILDEEPKKGADYYS